MEEMIAYIVYVAENYGVVMLIMIALIELILFIIKKPIKMCTKKIKNEKLRKLVNKIFIILAFVLSFVLYLIGNVLLPQFVTFKGTEIVVSGAFAIVLYAFGDGVITINKKTLTKTSDTAKIITDAISNVANDKADEKEIKSAVESFKSLCNEVTNDK